jgi:hypothetical protein
MLLLLCCQVQRHYLVVMASCVWVLCCFGFNCCLAEAAQFIGMLLQHREGCPRKVFNCLSPFCGGLLGCCISHLLLQEASWLPVEPLGVAVVAAASWCGNRTAAPSCNQLMHCCHPHRIVVMSCSCIPYAAGTAVQQLHFMSCSCNMLLALQVQQLCSTGQGLHCRPILDRLSNQGLH